MILKKVQTVNDNRWTINRAGLLNFWYYDDEEFEFSDGKLLLRGANGSGKSVTMQSFVPLLLDGNKSPERLDPFGSRARKIENYLIGEDESSTEESTGYLFMEFKKKQSEIYMTIGMGLNAKRGKPLSFWGFLITDGRRAGRDFKLYKDMGGKVPLSKRELKNKLGEGGILLESQREYMDAVNKHLFGFDNIEDYDELVKLLIQIRTPKLSKDFKPTVIYEIMNNSLQPLSDEDLRPMSEAIENMDNLKAKLDELKVNKTAADKLKKAYDQYNGHVLFEKAKRLLDSAGTVRRLQEELSTLEVSIASMRSELVQEETRLAELEIERHTLEEKKRELEKHDSYAVKERIAKIETETTGLEAQLDAKKIGLENRNARLRSLEYDIKRLTGDMESLECSLSKRLNDMDDAATDISFDEHFFMRDELEKSPRLLYDFSYITGRLEEYSKRLAEASRALEDEKAASREHDRMLGSLEELSSKKKAAEKILDEADMLVTEEMERFAERVRAWESGNMQLKLTSEILVDVSQKIFSYGDGVCIEDVLDPVRSQHGRLESEIREEMASANFKAGKTRQLISEKESEIAEWEKRKEPEPPLSDEAARNRERLRNLGIPFIPLYKAVEFQDDIAEREKGVIEEALMYMGMLDALIISDEHRKAALGMEEGMADKYVFSSPRHIMHELSLKVRVARNIGETLSIEWVDNALKSVLLDCIDGDTFINESGVYGIGPIRGVCGRTYTAKYMGTLARERFKEETISKLLSEKETLISELMQWEESLEAYNKKLQELTEEWNGFPGFADIDTAIKTRERASLQLEIYAKNVMDAEDEAKAAHIALQEARKTAHELTRNVQIPVILDAYREACSCARDYSIALSRLESVNKDIVNANSKLDAVRESAGYVEHDLDEIRYDIGVIERDMKRNDSMKSELQKQLELMGYDEIEKEIESCIKSLASIPELIKGSVANRTRAEEGLKAAGARIEQARANLNFESRLRDVHADGFEKELSLRYVEIDAGGEIELSAEAVRARLQDEGFVKKGVEEHIRSIQEKYHEIKQYMAEYALKIDRLFEEENEYENERLLKAVRSNVRLEIMGKVSGRYIGFYDVIAHINAQIEENDKLLKESDRTVFEDILAKTISRKMRAKIYHSEEWVKKMNSLMEGMNTSSGLSFSLAWKSKSAEDEQQLDSSELVKLLKKDGHLLLESELESMSMHFRSKIAQVRRQCQESDKHQTFHAIMKDVLDYRKWFEFRLYYRKTNESKKELTNNAFDRFSGGEKAMAMYVPLFSAVYAKYRGARSDCPRIISLDEAFAGVDENNIRDMFRLLGELELEYIINSQILWGDYDTVSSLAICELQRPDNADFVTVIRHRWNGIQMELLENE